MSIYRDAMRGKKQSTADVEVNEPVIIGHSQSDFAYSRQFIPLVDSVITGKHKYIGFTGPSGKEGTSTVARHFAYQLASNLGSLAQNTGSDVRRVLLINFNFGEDDSPANSSGNLAGFLNNSEQSLADCLIHQLMPGVDYLPAGPMLRPPLEFTALFLWRLKGENAFDSWSHVVFDCPPVLGHRETLTLHRHLDITFLMLKHASTKRDVAATAVELLKDSGNLAGAVLNHRKYRIPEWIYRWV